MTAVWIRTFHDTFLVLWFFGRPPRSSQITTVAGSILPLCANDLLLGASRGPRPSFAAKADTRASDVPDQPLVGARQ
jgi:hypothetical protein